MPTGMTNVGRIYEAEQFVRAKRLDHRRHRPEPLSGCGYLYVNHSGDQNGRQGQLATIGSNNTSCHPAPASSDR
jgi:hypothetical protein